MKVVSSINEQRLLCAIDEHRVGRIDRNHDRDSIVVLSFVRTRRALAHLGKKDFSELLMQVEHRLLSRNSAVLFADRDHDNVVLFVTCGFEMRVVDLLEHVLSDLATATFEIHGERVCVTPATGFALSVGSLTTERLLRRAQSASRVADRRLGLGVVAWRPELEVEPVTHLPPLLARGWTNEYSLIERSHERAKLAKAREPYLRRSLVAKQMSDPDSELGATDGSCSLRGALTKVLPKNTAVQIGATVAIGLGIPYVLFNAIGAFDADFSVPLCSATALALVGAAAWKGVTCLSGRDSSGPAEPRLSLYPPASAIISAYLPNESATIIDTLKYFLELDYSGPLEILLAYNTPQTLPIIGELEELADSSPRLRLLRVEGSPSLAWNVNAALSVANGELVGIFSADQHPETDSFKRAWSWISDGADVVQGPCFARNRGSSWVARLVACEFESIQVVNHASYTSVAGLREFGRINGYWRASVLRRVRMRSMKHMVTEDVDGFLRALALGARFVFDPALSSQVLAPLTIKALLDERMGWVQGQLQVFRPGVLLASFEIGPSIWNRVRLCLLVSWSQIRPWVTLQIAALVLYLCLRPTASSKMSCLVALLIAMSVYVITVGAVKTCFVYRRAGPKMRLRRYWLFACLLLGPVLIGEFHNAVTRAAQLRRLRTS